MVISAAVGEGSGGGSFAAVVGVEASLLAAAVVSVLPWPVVWLSPLSPAGWPRGSTRTVSPPVLKPSSTVS